MILVIFLSPMAAFGLEIEGQYNCEGSSLGTTGVYKGTVSIIKNGEAYNVTWTIGTQTYIGVGILKGNIFSVGYTSSDKSWFGVIVYKISEGTFTGTWAMNGGKKLSSEKLTKR